ncbi:mobile mystery protein B [Altericroceibacterium spongiae]|uniref:Mobile mystery protein B n=1 Tax=Altericroceibacterium spongiae TaxID=2320269 RepID=A0A420EAD1_9SPHN|nr:mobile mystery protein B [Altericroceibacterium spongiae]RKF17636.1 mobile mystery protein B [Altericroceibacterium spongiae]
MTGLGEEPDGATPLDPDELEGLKFGHVTTSGELNELEQANIESSLRWLQSRRKRDVLSEEYVRELHRRLFGDVWTWAGTFRLTEKNIGVDPIQIGVQLRNLLDDARYWSEHRIYSPLEAAARFHHRLVQIHCFANGNGCHARIMADEYLRENFDHPPIDWAAGHDLMQGNERRDTYIAALRKADGHDHDPLLKFVGAIDG